MEDEAYLRLDTAVRAIARLIRTRHRWKLLEELGVTREQIVEAQPIVLTISQEYERDDELGMLLQHVPWITDLALVVVYQYIIATHHKRADREKKEEIA